MTRASVGSLPQSGTVVHVDDNAGSLTVDSVDGGLATVGTTTDAEATANGTLVALLKRLRTLLSGGLPAALAAGGGLKVEGVAGGVAQPVSGTFFQATQPVSGTVTATQGTAAAASGAWPSKLVDSAGVNVATVKAASTAIVAADLPLAVGLHPTSPLPTGANTIGALTANQSVNLAQVAGTAASTGSRVTDAGVQSVFQAAPASANILVGHVAHTATTAAATVITIPVNRTWVGTISVTANVYNTAVTGTTAGQAQGLIATTGANTVPAAATVVSCEARVGANTATIGGGVGDAVTVTIPMVVQTGASGATLTLASTIAGTGGRVAAMCSGYLI